MQQQTYFLLLHLIERLYAPSYIDRWMIDVKLSFHLQTQAGMVKNLRVF